MPTYQVVEKDDFGTDWHQVRYGAYATGRFDTIDKALEAATRYLTDVNCNNSLTAAEKMGGSEAFMLMKDDEDKVTGCFMGVLDGKDWYITYPKDISKMVKGEMQVLHKKGDPIKDEKWYELEGKTQVTVRPVPGT